MWRHRLASPCQSEAGNGGGRCLALQAQPNRSGVREIGRGGKLAMNSDAENAGSFATPLGLRRAVRLGRFSGQTSGLCPGALQVNLAILPGGRSLVCAMKGALRVLRAPR